MYPPPTTNILDAHQRARLVRSARKLEHVLGSTPQLVGQHDASSSQVSLLPIGCSSGSRPSTPFSLRTRSTSPSSRPSTPASISTSGSPSIYSSSTNTSMTSLALSTPRTSSESLAEPKSYAATRGRRSKELPHPLILRLNAVPMPPNDTRGAYSQSALPPTPSTARSSSAPPVTPTTPVPPTASEVRRKRMAKLARTLGEPIPVDLVFPSPRPPQHPSSVVGAFPAQPPSAARPLPQHRPAPPPSAMFRIEPAQRQRSMSIDLEQAASSATMGASASVAMPPLPASRSSRTWVTGGDMWTGEWNRRDIREVQHQLRKLR